MGQIHIPIKKKWVNHIQFPWKKGAYRIPGSAEKGGYSGRTSVPCHIYGVTPELLFYCARKASNKTIKVTGNNGHELVLKAVASYLCMNVHPYQVDFNSD